MAICLSCHRKRTLGLASWVWMRSFTRSMGAVAVFAMEPETPPCDEKGKKSTSARVSHSFALVSNAPREEERNDGRNYGPRKNPVAPETRSPRARDDASDAAIDVIVERAKLSPRRAIEIRVETAAEHSRWRDPWRTRWRRTPSSREP